ncbi:RNA polymerase sigma factor [Luethyella okanaganae]|uniref:RNA polymerase sigma factor n=1 Tax=Luethyella okanaganae TaxID=69372 RepID=A0ABW1VE13_9MICO
MVKEHGEFTDFYTENYSLIHTIMQRRLGDVAEAEDLTSEVFRIAWKHHCDGAALTLPWLYQTARNVVGNEYRRTARSVALIDRASVNADSSGSADADEKLDMQRALRALGDSDREILHMAYWEDLNGKEIAAILDCSVATVWVRLSRARASLKRHLESAASFAIEVS